MKSLALVALMVGCTPAASPTPTSVYGALIEAGCLSPTPEGVQSVADEHASADQPAWLACLFDGGAVNICGAPCQ